MSTNPEYKALTMIRKPSLSDQRSVGFHITQYFIGRSICRVKQPRTEKKHPIESLGDLSILPPELFETILYNLPLGSVEAFRRVNRAALSTVESLPFYKAIIWHAPISLAGILTIRTTAPITIPQLYSTLLSYKCSLCSNFAEFIYILTCKRVCIHCLGHQPEFLPLSPDDAERKFGINVNSNSCLVKNEVASMVHKPRLYETYGIWHWGWEDRIQLVDYCQAKEAGIKLHGGEEQMKVFTDAEMQAAIERHKKELADYNEKLNDYNAALTNEPSARGYTERYRSSLKANEQGVKVRVPIPPRRPTSPKLSDKPDDGYKNPHRWVAVVYAPWLVPHNNATAAATSNAVGDSEYEGILCVDSLPLWKLSFAMPQSTYWSQIREPSHVRERFREEWGFMCDLCQLMWKLDGMRLDWKRYCDETFKEHLEEFAKHGQKHSAPGITTDTQRNPGYFLI
ncbi:hypothetical protein ABW19_dt0200209 [Dactylella cylindrospora]|nr:hypothetical protein ABW19_dt0200209 [Dactylella cylindrospora]